MMMGGMMIGETMRNIIFAIYLSVKSVQRHEMRGHSRGGYYVGYRSL